MVTKLQAQSQEETVPHLQRTPVTCPWIAVLLQVSSEFMLRVLFKALLSLPEIIEDLDWFLFIFFYIPVWGLMSVVLLNIPIGQEKNIKGKS